MEVMLMSEQMRKELKDKGFLILQTWHIFLIIASILLSTGVMIGAMQNRLNNVEIRTGQLEVFREEQEEKNVITGTKRDRQFHEIQMNMKKLMEKNGLDYQKVED